MKWGLTKHSDKSHLTLDSIKKDFDRIFDNFLTMKPSSFFASDWLPSVDVKEDDKAVHVTAEVPGMSEKDLNVTLEDSILTISGEKKEEKEEKSKERVISERKYGSFSRSIALPNGIKTNAIKANFKNGILKIDLPKDESVQTKKISIDIH